MIQSLAQCDNSVVKITQNRVFLAEYPLPEMELLKEDLGTSGKTLPRIPSPKNWNLGTSGKILPRIFPTELEFLVKDFGPLG